METVLDLITKCTSDDQVDTVFQSIYAQVEYCLNSQNRRNPSFQSAVIPFLQSGCQKHHADAFYLLGKCYEDGYGATKNVQKAIDCYLEAVDMRHVNACVALSSIYHHHKSGKGVAHDDAESFRLNRLAIEWGHAASCRYLGRCYRDGTGVTPNKSTELCLYRLAAMRGDAKACYSLGKVYYYHRVVPQNDEEAVALFTQGMNLRHGPCCRLLAKMYLSGRFVSKSQARAMEILSFAVDCGDTDSLPILAGIHMSRKEYRRAIELYGRVGDKKGNSLFQIGMMYNQGSADLRRNCSEAARYFEMAADKGNFAACQTLALMLITGNDIEPDVDKAIRLLKGAIDGGDGPCCHSLAMLYLRGSSVTQDFATAAKYFQLGTERGDYRSFTDLGLMHQRGRGMMVDHQRAYELYQAAFDGGYKNAAGYLGYLYHFGEYVRLDHTKAAELYLIAIDAGSTQFLPHLASIYADGIDFPRNYKKAYALCQRAIALNIADGNTMLGRLYQHGKGVVQDYASAAHCFRNAEKAGSTLARTELDALKETADPRTMDPCARARWYMFWVQADDADAYAKLAALYIDGIGVARDFKTAARLFRAGADRGDQVAMCNLARMIRRGEAVESYDGEANTLLWKVIDS